jgi:hypothetical protein
MSPGDWASFANAGAGWLALLLAAVSLVKNHRTNRRQEELNDLLIQRERQAAMDAMQADLSANLVREGQNHILEVFNRGRGTARNIRLSDLDESRSILITQDLAKKFPVESLAPQDSIGILVAMALDRSNFAHVRLTWDDDAGNDHERDIKCFVS